MFEKIRLRVVQYIEENFDDLLELDLKWARIMGAPAPHTISSYSHLKWKWLEPIIDRAWFWLFDEKEHCLNDYKRVTAG
jgi:hypothetical protein